MWQKMEVLKDIVAEAWQELKRSRLRTYLAIFSVVVGAMGFTLLLCTFNLEHSMRGRQDTREIRVRLQTFNPDDSTVFQRKQRLKRYELIPEDGEAIERECRNVEQVFIHGSIMADFKGKQWDRQGLTSTNNPQADILSGRLVWGRIFTSEEIKSGARVVILNWRSNRKLWPWVGSAGTYQPGSRYVHINGMRFEVIGMMWTAVGKSALIPYTCMQELFWDANWYIDVIPKRGFREAVANEINDILNNRIGDPGYSYTELPGMSYEKLKIYTFFGIIGVLVLFSAGMAVSNKAYIDALERAQQFAIRRALGATTHRIYAVVLMESALICGFGSFYGALIGWMVFASFSAWKWIERSIWYALPLSELGIMFLFIIAIGIIGSLQGAAIAGRVNPAEVLTRKDIV